MKNISQELQATIDIASESALAAHHGSVTVDHLLLALLDNTSAAEVLKACAANIDDLRKSITVYINGKPTIAGNDEVSIKFPLGYQWVIQRAARDKHSGGPEVTGADVLVQIFVEDDSHAVQCLRDQGVTQLDVMYYIANGVRKGAPSGLQVFAFDPQTEALMKQAQELVGPGKLITLETISGLINSFFVNPAVAWPGPRGQDFGYLGGS